MESELRLILKGTAFSNTLKKALEGIRKKYGLKHVEMEVLCFLAEFPEYDTPSQAAEMLYLTRGHVSQAIDVLIRKGLITGSADARDRRSVHYAATEKAWPVIQEIRSGHRCLEQQLFEGIGDEDREVFRRVMNQIGENAGQITEKMRKGQEN